ncbi:hypothetical protein [Arenibacter echinorum]|uniref:hypothetical protein n=1 Tax=Arenibacter echinorum TaxID=440515 RepID=UPI000DBA7C0F|nr:hypothetical protein [Arenibacter echinorum]
MREELKNFGKQTIAVDIPYYITSINTFAPTATNMTVTLSIILGFQLILQAIQYDIINTPKTH